MKRNPVIRVDDQIGTKTLLPGIDQRDLLCSDDRSQQG